MTAVSQARPRAPWALRLLALVAFEVAVLVVLHWVGRHDFMRVHWNDLSGWLESTPPEDVLGAAIRTLALVYGYWSLAATIAYAGGVLTRNPHSLGRIRWLMVPGTRRLIEGVLAISITGGSLNTPGAPALAADDPVATQPEPDRQQPPRHFAAPPSDVAGKLALYQAETALADPHPAAASYVVQQGDTLWEIARNQLGDPNHWTEIWHLNHHRVLDTEVDDPTRLQIGWVLEIPSLLPQPADLDALPPWPNPSEPTAPREVTVQPGDNLWAIAERVLAHEFGREPTNGETAPYWRDTVALNRTRLDSGNASLIYPGETVLLPSTGPASTSTPSRPHPPPATPAPSPGSNPTSDPSSPAQLEDSPTNTPTTPNDQGSSQDDNDSAVPIGLTTAGVALAGVLAWLERRRRVQQRRRLPGQMITPPTPEVAAVEATMRAAADHPRSELVHAALRAAAADGPHPALRWVEAGPDEVLFVLAGPAASPEGFIQDAPNRWRTQPDAQELRRVAADLLPTSPALCPMGRTDTGIDILLDLEAHPLVAVTGDPDRCRQFLAAIATAVGTMPWSVNCRVIVTGLATRPAGPAIETQPDLVSALDQASHHSQRIARSLMAANLATPHDARANTRTPDTWDPVIVVSAEQPSEPEAQLLASIAAGEHPGVAIVCAVPDHFDAGTRCHLDADGALQLEGLESPIRAIQLADNDIQGLHAIVLDAERRETETIPPATSTRSPDTGGLDALLETVEVLIKVLGEVGALRHNDLDPHPSSLDSWDEPLRIERQRTLEVLCYLSLRAGPVDREDLEAALFPNGANAQRTFHNAVTGARRAVGEILFPHPENGRYLLSERIATDYGVMCELIAQAHSTTDPATRTKRLTEAMSLVNGEPFVGTGRGYAWVGPHRGLIVAQVVDAAEELAELHLASGDWKASEHAARQGLRAFPSDERLHRILMRAAHTAGNLAGVTRAYQELVDALADPDTGVEPDDTVHPDTIDLLEQLLGRRPA